MYSKDELVFIFQKTGGDCHLCGKPMVLSNYGEIGTRGAWEVDHSNPEANGGTDYLRNLFAAHVACNRAKRDRSTQRVRQENGLTRAPYSSEKRTELRTRNALVAGGTLMAGGAAVAGPPGALIGFIAGLVVGDNTDPR